jgi:hypothetical protein
MANQGHPYVVVGEHFDGLIALSSVHRRAVETVTQRALESVNDALGADENYHEAKQDRADLRAELVIAVVETIVCNRFTFSLLIFGKCGLDQLAGVKSVLCC